MKSAGTSYCANHAWISGCRVFNTDRSNVVTCTHSYATNTPVRMCIRR